MARLLLSACILLSAVALEEEALSLMQMRAKISSRHQAPAPAHKIIHVSHLADRMFKRFDQDENGAIDIHEAHHMFRSLLKEERIEKLPTPTQIEMLKSLAGDDQMLQKDEFQQGLKAFLNAKVQVAEHQAQQGRSLESEVPSGQDLESEPLGGDQQDRMMMRGEEEEKQQNNEEEAPWITSHPKWEERDEERQRLKEHPNVADRIDRRAVRENQGEEKDQHKNDEAWRTSHPKWEERYEERQRLKDHPNVADRIDRRDVRENEKEEEEKHEDATWRMRHPNWEPRAERLDERQRREEHPNVADRIDRRDVRENEAQPNVAARVNRRVEHKESEDRSLESETQSEDQQDGIENAVTTDQHLSSVAEQLFKMADSDGNGVVDPEEAQLMFTKLVAKGTIARMPTPDEVEKILAFAGDDGLLQRDEFEQVVRFVLAA